MTSKRLYLFGRSPPNRQESSDVLPGEAVVDQVNNADVFGGANNSAGGLHNLLQPRVEVGVVIARPEQLVHPRFHLLIDGVDLWQSQRSDESADQTPTRQVDTLGKSTTQYGEANTATFVRETCKKGMARLFMHAPRLHPVGQLRMLRSEQVGHLLQVVKAAEERQVVARTFPKLLDEQVDDWLK